MPACPPRCARLRLPQHATQLEAAKDAVVFLVDAGASMLQPSAFDAPADWPPSLPFRSLDVALHLVQSAMRHKCVALARAHSRSAEQRCGSGLRLVRRRTCSASPSLARRAPLERAALAARGALIPRAA